MSQPMVRETEKEKKTRLARQRAPYDKKYNDKRSKALGRKPQSESNARRKPWLVEGISKATWYNRRRKFKGEQDAN